ncbi:MAG: ParB/Srx family N-terminal domain-containing protein [Treponema sp.]|nr:ParB/Srx family N-terminal domain-containing protein [Treponema sp.]
MKIIDNVITKFQKSEKIKWIDISQIKVDEEFKSIFPQKEADVQKIVESMKTTKGYDSTFPIILTKGVPGIPDKTIVDGHTRLLSSKIAGIEKLAFLEKSFKSRADIIAFIYRTQMARRNLTEQEQYAYFQKMAGLKKENGKQLKTDQQIADELELSRRQISKFKEVEKKSDPETLESFKAGEISLNAAYQKIKSKESETKKTQAPTVSRPAKKAYMDGYTDGIKYAIKELSNGKSAETLLTELAREASHE